MFRFCHSGFSSGFLLGEPSEKDFTKAYGSMATKRKHYVGVVKNFYKKVSAAEIKLEASGIKEGDRLLIIGSKTGVVYETASSMQVCHKPVKSAEKGSSVGIMAGNILRKNDKVYIIKSA